MVVVVDAGSLAGVVVVGFGLFGAAAVPLPSGRAGGDVAEPLSAMNAVRATMTATSANAIESMVRDGRRLWVAVCRAMGNSFAVVAE